MSELTALLLQLHLLLLPPSPNTYLMNAMCDQTGFVLVNATNHITAGNLARIFLQEVLLKIGLCGLVVVDDGSTFKGIF